LGNHHKFVHSISAKELNERRGEERARPRMLKKNFKSSQLRDVKIKLIDSAKKKKKKIKLIDEFDKTKRAEYFEKNHIFNFQCKIVTSKVDNCNAET
jgi:hypothetical protein